MPWWPSQRRKIGFGWRVVKSMRSNWSEMPVFGSNWQTWYLVVCKQACPCHQEVNESMRQTFSTFDFLHSSHKWMQTILSCGRHSTTMSIGIISRFRFCRWLGGFEINIGRNLMHFLESHVRANKLDVQETSVSHSSTEAEIIFLDARLRVDGIPALDLWNLVVEVFHCDQNQLNKTKVQQHRETCGIESNENFNRARQVRVVSYWWCASECQFFSVNCYVVRVWGQWGRDQDDNQKQESNNETCVKNPQSFSWLVVWQNQFGHQDSNSVKWLQTPDRRHFDQRTLHTWRME